MDRAALPGAGDLGNQYHVGGLAHRHVEPRVLTTARSGIRIFRGPTRTLIATNTSCSAGAAAQSREDNRRSTGKVRNSSSAHPLTVRRLPVPWLRGCA